MSKKTIIVLGFFGLLVTNMSFGLAGCAEKENRRKAAEFPPELELDQRDDAYPDEYIREVPEPKPKKTEHKRERAGQH
jgi:hypothetical protein